MKSDDQLGMGASITRRDFVQGVAAATVGLSLSPMARAVGEASKVVAAEYPPTKTGLRGSHPGSFETAHAIAREGRSFPAPAHFNEHYDLVVVGAGISGLAAAYYYRERFGADARVLLLENHDDFGGHARRNEFHQGGQMRLSMGGVHNLEWWQFSPTVKAFLDGHGVDVKGMRDNMQFAYGRTATHKSAMWFDEETYGVDRLVTDLALDVSGVAGDDTIDQIPISEAGRASLKAFCSATESVFADKSEEETERYLRSISYPDFLRKHGGLTDDAAQLFDKLLHGGWGVEMRALSAMEVLEDGLPGRPLAGLPPAEGRWDYPVAMWPDGNASLARLQVARLIPEVAPGTTADNVALSKFDYTALDRPDAQVRLRLNSTVVNATDTEDGVQVSYVSEGEVRGVTAKHCVMACYHSIIPHLCPALPPTQAEAMKYQVKHPLVLTNVLIRNTSALDKLGIDGLRCPGRLHAHLFTFRGINTGGFEHDLTDDGPVPVVFWGSISPPKDAVTVKEQLRASRAIMLGLDFEDYEREVRTVLDGLLGPVGFDVEKDILAITVNRWPHGYAYDYLDLWDPDWAEAEAPHEVARQPFGNITIANADAAADAYTHAAIDEAYRAVQELPG